MRLLQTRENHGRPVLLFASRHCQVQSFIASRSIYSDALKLLLVVFVTELLVQPEVLYVSLVELVRVEGIYEHLIIQIEQVVLEEALVSEQTVSIPELAAPVHLAVLPVAFVHMHKPSHRVPSPLELSVPIERITLIVTLVL
jgi:hypothetical protein